MKFTYIDESGAPVHVLPTDLAERKEKLRELISGIPSGHVALLQSEARIAPALRSWVKRTARRQGLEIEVWSDDGIVYVKRA